MTDWSTISSLATAGGTLVLAVSTFAAVRSANRSAKVGERALMRANLPLLVTSHITDKPEKIRFADNVWVKVGGGHAHASATKNAIYFAISLRNVGQGMAVLDRWSFATAEPNSATTIASQQPLENNNSHRLTRDLYVAAADIGFWQGAIRDKDDSQFAEAAAAIAKHNLILIEIEYTDQDGGQRTVSRFGLTHRDKDDWLASAARHWRLDSPNPR